MHSQSTCRRFFAKVNPNGPTAHAHLGSCHVWTGGIQFRRSGAGYGKVQVGGHTRSAHRVAWEIAYGPIPAGLFVLHHCDTPSCVRAAGHLFLGTHQENMDDMVRKGSVRRRGERNGRARLTAVQVATIRMRYARGGIRQHDLAAEYGVSATNVSEIIRNKTWVE